MTYKVGVKINIDSKPHVLWTLDGYPENVRVFENKEAAEAFGELVWPNNYVIEDFKGE